MDFVQHVALMVLIYSILALSLDLIAGHTGLISVAQASLYGVGAYAAATLSLRGVPFGLTVVVGAVLAGCVSAAIAAVSIRVRDDQFMLATLAFQVVLSGLFANAVAVTNGPLGIAGIPRPVLLGWTVDSTAEFVILSALAMGICFMIVARMGSSPLGRLLHAIREDEGYAQALGKNTVRAKTLACVTSGMMAAVGGALYAHYVTFIDPTSFSVMESILVLSMIIIGGAGRRYGPLAGALALVVLPELMRFMGLPDSVAANVRQILYASVLVLLLMTRPAGLAKQQHHVR